MEGQVNIKLVRVKVSEMPYYVRRAFDGDEDLLSKFHTSPGTLDHCVNNTMGFITENEDHYKEDMELYSVVFNGNTVGYTIMIRNEKSPNELYSFGINKNYRKKEILMAWLAEVEKMLGKPYYIVLWSKNERAIKFFERNGFRVDRESKLLNDETKTLIVCQQGVSLRRE